MRVGARHRDREWIREKRGVVDAPKNKGGRAKRLGKMGRIDSEERVRQTTQISFYGTFVVMELSTFFLERDSLEIRH